MQAEFANAQVTILPGTYAYSDTRLTVLASGPLTQMRICDALAAAQTGTAGFAFIARAGHAGELARARMAMALARAFLGAHACTHTYASSLLLWHSARYIAAAHARRAIADALLIGLEAAHGVCVGLRTGVLEDVCALDLPLRELARADNSQPDDSQPDDSQPDDSQPDNISYWRSDPRLTTAEADMVTLTVRPHIGTVQPIGTVRHLRILELAGIGCGAFSPQHGGIRAVDGRDFPSGEPGALFALPYLQPGAGDLICNWLQPVVGKKQLTDTH
jgi:hypothetical protein